MVSIIGPRHLKAARLRASKRKPGRNPAHKTCSDIWLLSDAAGDISLSFATELAFLSARSEIKPCYSTFGGNQRAFSITEQKLLNKHVAASLLRFQANGGSKLILDSGKSEPLILNMFVSGSCCLSRNASFGQHSPNGLSWIETRRMVLWS